MRGIATIAVGLLLALPAIAGDLPIRPDPKLTPGAILTTDAAKVCQPGYSKTVRHTSGKLKALIYREYSLDRTSGHFEIDHLISLELGGADVAENLWPESQDTTPWNAHVKDKWRIGCMRLCAPASCQWSRHSGKLLRTGSPLMSDISANRRSR